MAEILEAIMLICFGLSWPINAYKGFKARTAAGSSWQFIALITLGYVAGIAAKFAAGSVNWVLIVYFVNLACLGINWGVYFRNCRLDAEARIIDAAEELKEKGACAQGAEEAAEKTYIPGVHTGQAHG